VASGQLLFASPAAMDALLEIPGIGPWTAQYIAMRAMQQADAFPSGDLVLRRVAGNLTARALDAQAERWRPWRAYAVMLLWQAANDKAAATKIAAAPGARSRKRKPDAKVDRVHRTRTAGGERTRRRRRA
jgi:3-methyladenine DNA glycosylase/8-oxoguanine DNA glycosylase